VSTRLPSNLKEREFWPVTVLFAVTLPYQTAEESKAATLLSSWTVPGYLRRERPVCGFFGASRIEKLGRLTYGRHERMWPSRRRTDSSPTNPTEVASRTRTTSSLTSAGLKPLWRTRRVLGGSPEICSAQHASLSFRARARRWSDARGDLLAHEVAQTTKKYVVPERIGGKS